MISFFAGSVARGDKVFGGSDEIGKGVFFSLQAACIVPGFAEFAAAANVSDGVNDAAVEETEAIGIEIYWHGDAVAAVAVEEERSGAVARGGIAIEDGERNFCAIGRGGVQAFAGVLGSMVAAENWLLFAQGALAGGNVEIEN